MSKLKTQILMTACIALAGGAMMSSEALAAGKPAAQAQIYGGGSTLVEQYWNVTGNCYGNPVPLLVEHSISPPANATSVNETPFNYVGTSPSKSQNCSTTQINDNDTINYIGSGSGSGVAGVFGHDPHFYGPVNTTGDSFTYWPTADYGLSDYGLAQSDLAIYNNGGTEGSSPTNVCIQPFGTPASGTCSSNASLPGYGNPLQLYGPLIAFPFSVDPVAIAYNSVYEKVFNPSNSTVTSYSFNVKSNFRNAEGGLRLSPTTLCKIFTGQITNWNDPAIKKDNGTQSLEDPSDPTPKAQWSVPLQIVGRSDSSGTTSIFYRHLAAVCGGLITGSNPYVAAGGKTLPGSLLDSGETTTAPGYNGGANYPAPGIETAGFFTTANGSSGVAAYLAFSSITPNGSNGNRDSSGAVNENAITLGRIGYIGPDFTVPYVTNVGSSTTQAYGLNSAALENSQGQFEVPTPNAALSAFSVLSPPTGTDESTGNPNASEPWMWVQPIASSSPLANPTTKGSYPIVGTTNFMAYQCYANVHTTNLVKDIINYVEGSQINTSVSAGILGSAGLGPLPTAWRTAILNAFTSNTSGSSLEIAVKGTSGACSVSGVIGG